MKKGLKVISTAAVLALGMGALAGCGGSDELVMGTNAAFVPFEFVTSNGLVGEFDGVDVVIASKVAEKTGQTLKIEDMAVSYTHLDVYKRQWLRKALSLSAAPEIMRLRPLERALCATRPRLLL